MIETTVSYDPVVGLKQSTIAKDLRLNLQRLLKEGALGPVDAHLALLALASATEYSPLKDYSLSVLAQTELNEEQIREASESSAIMAMLNTYYRFRTMVGKDEEYRTAGLRMTSLARPALGKVRFEMLAFAVSVANGCQSCVRSHEQALRDAGVSVDQIHDLARLAAVVKALKTLNSV